MYNTKKSEEMVRGRDYIRIGKSCKRTMRVYRKPYININGRLINYIQAEQKSFRSPSFLTIDMELVRDSVQLIEEVRSQIVFIILRIIVMEMYPNNTSNVLTTSRMSLKIMYYS